jgi:hypothetical protein
VSGRFDPTDAKADADRHIACRKVDHNEKAARQNRAAFFSRGWLA